MLSVLRTLLALCLLVQEYDRPNSAYMLFYERLGGKPALPEAAAAAAVSAAPSAALQPTEAPAASSPAGVPQPAAEAADTEMAASPEAGPQPPDAAPDSIQGVMVDADSAGARAVRAILGGSLDPTAIDEDAGAPAHECGHRDTVGLKASLVM